MVVSLMEPVKSKKSRKRKRKTSKANPTDSSSITVVKPDCFDGMTNWLNFQKTLESTKERVPNNCKASGGYKGFKKRRLFKSKSEMPITPIKSDIKDNNDSGWASGSDLSPRPSSGATSKQSHETLENNPNINPDELNELTKVLSMDCEMVGTGYNGKESMLARVSIVNAYGQCVYDAFVKPKERVTDFRTAISGVRPSDIKNGKDLFEVQQEVSNIIEGRKLVGHALKHDFNVLFLSHPRSLIRDTSKYKPFRDLFGGRTPSLKKLTSTILGCDIQSGEHSSVEDAQAAMLLYLRHKKEWEKQIRSNRRKKPPTE